MTGRICVVKKEVPEVRRPCRGSRGCAFRKGFSQAADFKRENLQEQAVLTRSPRWDRMTRWVCECGRGMVLRQMWDERKVMLVRKTHV